MDQALQFTPKRCWRWPLMLHRQLGRRAQLPYRQKMPTCLASPEGSLRPGTCSQQTRDLPNSSTDHSPFTARPLHSERAFDKQHKSLSSSQNLPLFDLPIPNLRFEFVNQLHQYMGPPSPPFGFSPFELPARKNTAR